MKGNLINNRSNAKCFASFGPLSGAASQAGTVLRSSALGLDVAE